MEVRPIDDTAAARLAARLRVRVPTARCLIARGIDGDGAADFLAPRLGLLRKPEGELAMAGFATAADRVTRAVLRGERVAVFGDYDVDGVTTCALLTSFLRGCGVDVVARVARRDEGYGFGAAAAAELCAAQPGLIITGDCGTSDVASIETARAAGIDVVVVDHHTVPERGELIGQVRQRERCPAQRGGRIPAPGRLHQTQQRVHHTRIGLRDRFTARTGATHPTRGLHTTLQLGNPLLHPRPRRPGRAHPRATHPP